jgi:histidinol dehydrogenase
MLKVEGFEEFMSHYRGYMWEDLTREEARVREIMDQVRRRGDDALRELTLLLDGVAVDSLEVPKEDMDRALGEVGEDFLAALRESRDRIAAFHRHQGQKDWSYTGPFGEVLGQKVTPLERVGSISPAAAPCTPPAS